MSAKFTKGPWSVSSVKINGNHMNGSWGVACDGFVIADVTSGPTFGIVDDIQKANANLIAVAPEMHDFIEHILSTYDLDGDDTKVAIALLKKARGK